MPVFQFWMYWLHGKNRNRSVKRHGGKKLLIGVIDSRKLAHCFKLPEPVDTARNQHPHVLGRPESRSLIGWSDSIGEKVMPEDTGLCSTSAVHNRRIGMDSRSAAKCRIGNISGHDHSRFEGFEYL